MLRFLTAGESHGPALTGIIEGLPANLQLDVDLINHELQRRQQVQGRGARMSIESDVVRVLGGLRAGRTLGSPLALLIENRDHANWQHVYNPAGSQAEPITPPRAGHADYPGLVKDGFSDVRDVIERASARETAMRTAIGAVAKQCLARAGIEIYSRVTELGPLQVGPVSAEREYYIQSMNRPLGYPHEHCQKSIIDMLEECQNKGVSVGGIFEVVAFGVPVGLGSYVQADERLDGQLAAQLMSIPAVKGVEFGRAFDLSRAEAGTPGDSLCFSPDRGVYYEGNVNAGVAGGMSTGQPLIMRCAVKPIPTAMPGTTGDLATNRLAVAVKERSDTTAVPAAAIVGEAVVAWVLLSAGLKSFGSSFLSRH